MTEILFQIEEDKEVGGYVASWDDAPGCGGITTEGDTLEELVFMIKDAVLAYFETDPPTKIRLHFIEDPTFVLEAETYESEVAS